MDRYGPEHEKRRRACEMLFDFELMCLREEYQLEGPVELHYDRPGGVYRFSTGRSL